MKKYLILLISFLIALQISGQDKPLKKFEGKIKFIKITQTDTTYFAYFVKGDMVRFISYDPCIDKEENQEYLLFFLNKKKIVAIKPTYQTYIVLPNKKYVSLPSEEFQFISSNNYKTILGRKCYQWREKNKNENTEIAFWVNKDYNYDFFVPMLKLWNRVEKHATYFLQIPDTQGAFPFLSTERSLVRDFRMKLLVTEIDYMSLDDTFFTIPANFANYEH